MEEAREKKRAALLSVGSATLLVSLKAFEAEFKMVLIWLPELMHPAAANALLKLLEEPAAAE